MTRPAPLEITRTGANQGDVRIRWSDGHDAVYSSAYLRARCCCAVCSARPDLVENPAVQALAIEAVGGYAIRFAWSDGHDAGVYSYAYLRGICPCARCRGERGGPGAHSEMA